MSAHKTLPQFLHLTPTDDGSFTAQSVPNWSQGRTLYGGASAALCLASVLRSAAPQTLPPLRSAQFAFIGPSSGALRLTPTLLRQGKASAIFGVDLFTEEGLATRATLAFGQSRESALDYSALPAPTVADPDDCPPFFEGPGAPAFTSNFEFRKAGGHSLVTNAPEARVLVWVRHKKTEAGGEEEAGGGEEAGGVDSATALLALADALPPAVMAMFGKLAPVSSLTWTVDTLGETLPSADEWLLLASEAEASQHGYSPQSMKIWDSQRRPVAVGRQQVTTFY